MDPLIRDQQVMDDLVQRLECIEKLLNMKPEPTEFEKLIDAIKLVLQYTDHLDLTINKWKDSIRRELGDQYKVYSYHEGELNIRQKDYYKNCEVNESK